MTTTQNLADLAKNPQAFDTELARLTDERDKMAREIHQANERLHELAKDRKSYRNTRVPVWGMTDVEVERQAKRAAVHGDQSARVVLTSRAAAQVMAEAITDELIRMDNAYTGWTRFFPSITKSQPHIHRSLHCHTLHPTTQMSWAPQLSGKTDAEAVAELDEALCSVCFPDAPVALHEYVSRKSTEAQAQRDAEKRERDAAKAAKTLTTAEQFKTGGRFGDHVTTVAKCRELIRTAVAAEVELEWINQPARDTDPQMMADADMLARMRRNRYDRHIELDADAARAAAILIKRENDHAGWGMAALDIETMRARKRQSARKEWGL